MDAYTALRLQIEWGADEALEEAPIDRLRLAAARAAPAAPPPPVAPPQAVPPGPGTAPRIPPADRAAEAAAGAATLDQLRAAIAGFDGGTLRATATNLVFAAGATDCGLLFVGEAPSSDADRSGDPFAGQIGSYLELMLRSIGLDRGGMMLAPLMPWRPPGDRPPSAQEIALFLPFLHRLIALTRPHHIVLLGPLPARAVLGGTPVRRQATPAWRKAAIPGMHESIDALVMPSPAILLRNPLQRKEAWAALRFLRRTLETALTAS